MMEWWELTQYHYYYYCDLIWFIIIIYTKKNYNRPFFTQTNLNNYDFKYISIYGKINKHISNTV